MIEINEEVNPLIDITSLQENQFIYYNSLPSCICKIVTIYNDRIELKQLDLDTGEITNYIVESDYKDFCKKIVIIDNKETLAKIKEFIKIKSEINNIYADLIKEFDTYSNKVSTFENSKHIKKLVDVLKHHFDESNYQIKYNEEEDVFDIILKYNDITITNSQGKSHFIKSLFVRVSFDHMANHFYSSMYGYAGELSILELISGYTHSHLRSNAVYWERFCTGTSEITGLLNDLNANNFDANRFDLFLYNLKEYITWESLEGGPYIKIEKLAYSDHNNTITSISKDQVKLLANKFLENKFTFNTKFNYSSKKIEIVEDFSFIDNINIICPPQYKGVKINGIVTKLFNSEEAITKAKRFYNQLHKFTFNNESYPKMYVEDELLKLDTLPLESHQSVIEGIKTELELKINQHFLTTL